MRILQLCNKPPRPSIDGGCLAMDALTSGFLEHGHEVKILSIHTPKHPYLKNKLDPEYIEDTDFEGIYVDTRVNIVDAFSNLLTQDSYNISRFFSPDFDMRLKRLLQRQKFDVIQFESLFMTPYLSTARRYDRAKCVLRSHNLEYLIWKRLADGTKNVPKKFYLNHLAKKLENFERDIIKRMHGIVSISKDDYAKYEKLGVEEEKLINVPFGIKTEEYQFSPPPEELSIFHLGSLEWPPNLEGVTWFLEAVWPAIHKKFPKLTFYIAGRKIPSEINTTNYPGIEIVGEVESAQDFMNTKSIMLVPILSAGGMRVKIIEGLALGKTVLSTTMGAEGIDYEKNKDIHIADTKEDFINHIQRFYDHPETLNENALNARNFVQENFDNDRLTADLLRFYQKLVDA